MLTLHTTGDGLVPVEDEKAYSRVVHEANDSAMLREIFIHRAGHCEFTPAETITALQTLDLRVTTGKWTGLTPAQLNNGAAALGPTYNFIYVNNTPVSHVARFSELSTAAVSEGLRRLHPLAENVHGSSALTPAPPSSASD